MAQSYDDAGLGVGNAGMGTAGETRGAGKSAAMMGSRDPGGTCPLRG